MKIWTVDAFAKEPFTGNPAAVTIVTEFPEDTLCKKIAAEMNLSETAFVKPLIDGTYHIRWFTPTVEVKLCGHATLSAAHVLFQKNPMLNTVTFTSLTGTLTVIKENDGLILDFPLQKTGPSIPVEGIIELLDLNEPVIDAVQAYDDIILELESPKALRQIVLDPKDVTKMDCRGLIITAKGDEGYDFISRFFAPHVGVDEDPVTGSAHCKLAHYWQQKLNKDSFFAYQASKRGGEIHISIHKDRVHLKGRAITVLEGDWLV